MKHIEDFLNDHNIVQDDIDREIICSYFIDCMKKGLAGQTGGLAMIPSFCSPAEKIVPNEKVIVIDAGGTNLRTALVSFDDKGEVLIEDFRKTSMPGCGKEISAEGFINVFADEVERLIDKSNRIGFCFSYNTEILSNHDGRPITLGKEIICPQIIGKPLGKSLLEALSKRGHNVKDKKVIVVNDTVATLLAAQFKKQECHDSCIGFILGTGMNSAYIEKTANITKLAGSDFKDEIQIVNMESGRANLSLGDLDELFFMTTAEPYEGRFEKMISGAYLGPYYYFILQKACEEGYFSKEFASGLASLQKIETKDMNEPFSFGTEDDKADAQLVCSVLLNRVAVLCSACLEAVVLSLGIQKGHRVLLNIDGSTYYKRPMIKEYTQQYLSEALEESQIGVDFICVENSPVIGTAVAALGL